MWDELHITSAKVLVPLLIVVDIFVIRWVFKPLTGQRSRWWASILTIALLIGLFVTLVRLFSNTGPWVFPSPLPASYVAAFVWLIFLLMLPVMAWIVGQASERFRDWANIPPLTPTPPTATQPPWAGALRLAALGLATMALGLALFEVYAARVTNVFPPNDLGAAFALALAALVPILTLSWPALVRLRGRARLFRNRLRLLTLASAVLVLAVLTLVLASWRPYLSHFDQLPGWLRTVFAGTNLLVMVESSLAATAIVMVLWIPFIRYLGTYLYGIDLDPLPPGHPPLPGQRPRKYGEKDGTGQFNTLATFALAQGAALAALAKGEYEWLALAIYLGMFLLTVAWVAWLLRYETAPPNSQRRFDRLSIRHSAQRRRQARGRTPQRSFDHLSIQHGRWVLSFNLALGALLVFLAVNRLLPFQTRRVMYDLGEITVTATEAGQRYRQAESRNLQDAEMDKWIQLLGRSVGPKELYWIEQSSPFLDSYYTFSADLTCSSSLVFNDPVAFLVRRETGRYRPSYRQIPFETDRSGHRATLSIEDPNRGEVLVIIVRAGYEKAESRIPKPNDFDFKVQPHFAGKGKTF